MMNKIIDLSNNTGETLQRSDKAALILGDLISTYAFLGDSPTKEESHKISFEAEKILRYISIACDYLIEIKKDLMQTRDDLEIILDEAKSVPDRQYKNPMNEDFMQYVYARIDKALTGNQEFMQLQSKFADVISSNEAFRNKEYDNLTSELDAKREELCYIQGFNDALQLMKGADRCGK